LTIDDSRGRDRDGDNRGRDAAGPTGIPRRGWRDILIRVWRESSADNIGLVAAGVAFYAFLALVPLLAAFVMIYGLVADPTTVMKHIVVLFTIMPADAARLISEQMINVTQQAQGKTGFGALLALGLSIYGAMRGASAIVTALNIAYDEEEKRGIVTLTLLALAITIIAIIVSVIAALAISALALLERLMPGAPHWIIVLIRTAFWCLAALAASSAIAAVYRYAPNRRKAQWRWLTPGSVLATLAWLATALGFGFYTANMAHYNATYGALGSVVALLMWLYLSAYVLLLGAELNSELEHQTAVDTTAGQPRPMGLRGAYVADTLGETP